MSKRSKSQPMPGVFEDADLDEMFSQLEIGGPQLAAPVLQAAPEPSASRAHDTHLVIIAALCKKLKIDPAQAGASTSIDKLVQALGVSVDHQAIRAILANIPGALDRRAQ